VSRAELAGEGRPRSWSPRRLRKGWREHGRPLWRQLRPVVLVGAALAVIVLGTIGFDKYQQVHHPDHPYGFLDSLYRAVQLFGFGATLEPEIPRTLQIARFLGPVVAGYAVIRGLIALSREQLELLWFRLFLRNHVVVAGLGNGGFRLATTLDREGFKVVAIEKNPHNPSIAGCRERGIGVVKGDAADPAILRRACVERAGRLVITCGDDARNIDVANAASRVTDGRHRGVLTALAHLDDYDLLAMLKSQSLTKRSSSAFRLALFNLAATGADILVERHPPFAHTDNGHTHVVVVGFEGVARDLVIEILRRWQTADRAVGDELTLTIVDPGASESLARLRGSHPRIDELPDCTIEAWDLDAFAELQRRDISVRPTIVYVSLESEPQALSAALRLGGRTDIADVPVVVVLQDESSGMATTLESDGPVGGNVIPFGRLTQVFSSAAFRHTTNETLAIASHETHVGGQRAAGVTEEMDPSLVPWERLEESIRESNRLFADSIPTKLAALGCVAQPSRLVDYRDPPVTFTEEEVEQLAPAEHDRWSEDMKRHLGWRQGTGQKDARGKVHPLIDVPFDELPPENQEKDRIKVRSIPEILARAGFKVVRNAGRDPAPNQGRDTLATVSRGANASGSW
jgi:TrkA family protein/RyR domain-containing protein